MKLSVFSGAATALVTPMNKDGSINYQTFGKLIEHQIENKIDAIVVCGTTGEASTLSEVEHYNLLRYAVTRVNRRVKVIAGVGSNDTEKAKRLTLQAKKCDVDALLCVTPYYNKTTQNGLITHYNTIADTTDLPLILYNVPSRTGMNILPQTYKELSKHPNIVATKEANDDILQIEKTMFLCGNELTVFTGNDHQILPVLALGGHGVISVVSNILPLKVSELCRLFFDRKIKESQMIMLSLIPIIEAIFSEVNPIPIKASLNMLGFDVGECRMPLSTAKELTKEKIFPLLKGFNLL